MRNYNFLNNWKYFWKVGIKYNKNKFILNSFWNEYRPNNIDTQIYLVNNVHWSVVSKLNLLFQTNIYYHPYPMFSGVSTMVVC